MKTKLFSIILFLTFFTLVAQVPSYVPTNGLVAYYPFNGNANDLSGNNNNGINHGATPTTDRNGTANSALNFNGVNNYISIPYSTTIGVQQEITISFWVLFNGGSCGPRIIQSPPWGQCGGYTISTSSTSNSSRYFYTNFENCTAGVLSPSSPSLSGLTWHHVVWSASGLTGISKMYFDGILVDTDITSGFFTSINYFNRPITIGNIDATSCDWFGGKLDDICIWNRILTPQEISPLFTTCATPPAAPVASATQTFCATPAPTVADLVATGTGVQWYDAATAGNLIASTATLTNGQIIYASQTVSGCESTTRTAVTVSFNDPQITASATTVCSGTAVSLSASTTALPITTNSTLPTNLQNGLVGYWPFNGNANDTSGNNNNGTVNGATLTTDRFGNADSAYTFNSNYIQVPANSSLNNPQGSISFWLNTTNTNLMIPIKKNNYSGAVNEQYSFALNYSNLLSLKYNSSCQPSVGWTSFGGNNPILSNGNWHMVTATYSSVVKIYIDGTLISSTSAPSSSIDLCSGDLQFGREWSSFINYFIGKLDDITIYNRVITPQEVSQLYAIGQTTYLWSTGETTATINPTPTATTTYWCDVTVNGVTCRKSVTITVNTIPSAPTGAATQTFCATPAPTVADLVATGTGVQWYDAATAGNLLASTATLTNGQIAYASQTVSGCESNTRTAVTVSLNDPQITASATTVCSGTAVNLSASTTATLVQNCNLPTNLQNGLVGYWPFCGNANDTSGNNNNGTVNGATLTTDRFGNADSAYSFDGTSSYVEALNPLGNLTSNFTISSYVKISDWDGGLFVHLGIDQNGSPRNGFGYGYGGTQSVFPGQNYLGLVSNVSWYPSGYQFSNLNQWCHTAVVRTNNNLLFYINGINVGNATIAAIENPTNSLWFGCGSANYALLNGNIDDVAIFNRALSATEIAELYIPGTTYLWSTGETTATINPTPTATTTYWCDVTVNGVTCRKSVTITVNSTTPAPTGAATQTFCATPAPTVADLVATGTGIQWYDAATGGTLLASTANLTNGQIAYASQTDNGCESTTRTAVTVNLNDPQITASATTVCSGTAVSLSASTTVNPLTCNLPTNLQNGLVGYWPFCGNANDTSVNGNNGTVNGATLTTDRFGNANNAYSFDGIDDRISYGNLFPNIGAANTATTITLWMKTDTSFINGPYNLDPAGTILSDYKRQGSCCEINYLTALTLMESPKRLVWNQRGNSQDFNSTSSIDLTNNAWHQIVLQLDGISNKKVYIDGTLVTTENYDPSINYANQSANFEPDWQIGGSHWFAGTLSSEYINFYKGAVDDFSIYNRALSQAEITQLYNNNQTTYLWSTGETTATINPAPTATTTYWCDVTVNGVTCRKSVIITVNSTTPAPTGAATQTFCATPAPTVADLVATGTGIQWYDAATGGTLLASTANLTNGQIAYATQTVSGCESSTRTAVTVSLNDPQITASATTVCSGTTVNLSASTTALPNTITNTLPTNLQNGLVGYWPFNGNANDESGNNNNGTVNGALISSDRFGTSNNSYSFNRNIQNEINVVNSNSLNSISNITISLWVKLSSYGASNQSGYNHYINKSDQNNNHQFVFANNNTELYFYFSGGGNYFPTNNLPPLNQWTNVIVTYQYDGTIQNSFCKFYINGNLVDSILTTQALNYSNYDLRIGNFGNSFYNRLDGQLDDIVIWNRALNSNEIQQLYSGTSYTWSTGETTATINPTPTATTTYWCDVTVNGVTCRKSVTINVNSTTPAPTGAATQTFCATPAPTVADLVATGTAIQWYDAATAGNLLASTATLTNGQIAYASQTDNGCESNTRTAVTVNLNDPQITASATTVCSGTAVTLSVTTTVNPLTCNLPSNLQNGLVGYWPFCGNANDTSVNGNNGTVNGATLTTDRFGNTASAYYFNGINSKITCNPLNGITNTITLSTWIKSENNTGEWNGLVTTQNNTQQGFLLQENQNNHYDFTVSNGSGYYDLFSNNSISNEWKLLVCIIESNTLKIYVNGILDDSIQIGAYNLSSTANLNFGSRYLNEFYKGSLDDIGIWNRALSASEIAQLYIPGTTYLWSTGETTATINPTPTATTTYWCDVTVNGVTCRKYITITVNSTTPAPTGAATQTFCATQAPTIADLVATGTGVQWYDAATGGTLLASTANLTNGQIAYASQTDNGCESTDRLAVTINLNDPQITASATTVCSGTAVSLSATTTALPITTNSTLPTNLQNGLVGYWPFNGNANDESGNNNNGTVNGATLSTDRFGNVDRAYSFDGNGNITYQELFPFNQNIDASISIWVNSNIPNNGIQGTFLKSRLSSPDNNRYNFFVNPFNNQLKLNLDYREANFNIHILNIDTIPISNWINIVFVRNQNSYQLYINGILSNISNDNNPNLPNSIGWLLGDDPSGDSDYNGRLDDITIYNRALSQAEITQLYNNNQTTYLWSTGETTATINPTPTATTTYWCDVTVNGVTCRKSVTITVNSTTPAPTGAATQTFCATPAPTVADLVATGTGVQWYDAATAGNLLASTVALTNGQIAYATQTVSGCESTDRLAVTVSFNDPQITASATTVCSGTAVNLSANTTVNPLTCNLPSNLQNGLVGYWPFCGNANDTSGNNNNGTVNGATLTTDRFGNAASAYSFDGVNNYISVPNIAGSGNQARSIFVWVKYDSTSGYLCAISTGNPSTCNTFNLFANMNNSNGNIGVMGFNPCDFYSATTNMNNGQWHNIGAVYDGQGNLKTYLDGYEFSSSLISFNTIGQNNYFGVNNHNMSNYFSGILDDITIFNRALSPAEIAQLYTSAPTYLWSTGETTTSINPTPTANTTYWCDVTVNGVTCRKYITINVNSTTPAPTGAATQTFCATPAPTVADLVATGTGVQWYDAATTGNLLASTATLTNGQIVYASQTVSGCESTRTAVTVSLNDPQITASATTVCSGTAVNLSVAGSINPLNCNLPTNLQTGLVGYWSFCGNANDASGNNNNGTVNGATLTNDRFGNANSAYSFDGNDIITTNINRGTMGDNMSISCFYKYQQNSVINYEAIIGGNDSNGTEIFIGKDVNSLNIGVQDGNYNGNFVSGSNAFDGNWHHIIYTYENHVGKIYLDGQLSSTGNFTRCNDAEIYNFGSEYEGSGYFFHGTIDDIGFWNRILSDTEITQLYNNNQTTYLWSTGETTSSINPTPSATTTYWCDVTVNGVTCRKYITITVNPTPQAPTGAATQTFCATPAPTVADLVATGTGIQWYDAATGGTVLASTANLTNGQIAYASQTDNGCESTDRLAVTVSLNDPQITASATTVCSGTAVNLSASTTVNPLTCNLPTNLQNGLVGYWPFCGNANDTSGNNNNGTVNGATLTTDRFGNADSAYSFDGVDDFIETSNMCYNNGDLEQTISVWFNPTSNISTIGPGQTFFNTAPHNGFNFGYSYIGNQSIYIFKNSNPGVTAWNIASNVTFNTPSINLNTWHHALVVKQGLEYKFYYNGNLVNNLISTINPIQYLCKIRFGAITCCQPEVFNGRLDDIALFNRALSSAEITQLYNNNNNNQTTYLWSTGETTASINPTPTATTNYWCDVTVNGVTCRKYITITVDTAPAPTVTTPVTYCQNNLASPLVATGANLLWYTTPTGGTGSATAPTPDTTSAGTTTYYVSQSIAGCESPREVITVTVNATPAVPLVTTPLTYCQNSVAIPLAATGTNLLWYTAPNGGLGSAAAPTPSTATAGTTTYYVSQTVSGCESPREAIVVNITPTPLAPTAPTPITYCQYSTANALTATGTNLLWYVSATGGIGSALAPTPSTAIAGTRTYYVSQTVSGCESPRTPIVVFVSPAPFTPIVTSPVTYCQNSIATPLTAVGFNLLWYTSATGGTGSATAPTPSTTTPGTTTYYVSQTVLGCESLRAAIVVTIFATPTVPTVTTPVVYCQDATATPLIALGQNILWYTTATGGTGTITVPTPDTTTAGTTTYYASQTISGCEGPRTPIVVTVNATPALPTVTTPVSYCQFDTAATLSATGANLLWYTTATGGIGNATAPTPTTTIAGTTSFYVSQTVLGCVSPRAVIDVVVNAVPQAPTGNTLQYFCANIYPTIQNLILTQNSIYWYNSATSTTALAPSTPLVPGTTYYAAQYNSATGCQSLTRLAVTAYVINENAPTLVDDLTFCDTDEKTIADIKTNGANVIWYATPAGGTPLSSNYVITSSQVLYVASYNTSSGCESIDRQMVTITTVNCEVKANNLLTLDGNNLNDNLNIINIESFPTNEIEIYNRYGQLVWSTVNYNNTTNTFKGRANVGGVYQINENLPTGTYYYVLKYYNNYRNNYEVTKSYLYISNNN